MHSQPRIAIVGSGIAGLALAIALEKKGLTPTLFEASPALKPVGAGIVLAHNALKACERLGVQDAVIDAGNQINSMAITDSAGSILTRSELLVDGLDHTSIAIHRGDLQRVLIKELTRSQIQTGKRLKQVQPDKNEITLHFEDETFFATDYLISAEGIHSVIRQQLIPGSTPRYAGYTCWRGVYELPVGKPIPMITTEAWGKGLRLGMVPLSNRMVYWFAVKNACENDPALKEVTQKELLVFFKGWAPEWLDIIGRTPPENILHNDILDIDPLDQFAFNNILLTGDAAHATTPNMGQGGCQAIEDAAVLYTLLDKSKSLKQIFKEFEQLRIPRTKRVILDSRKIGQIGQLNNPLLVGIRNTLLRLIPPSVTQKQVAWLYNTPF